MSRSGYTDDDGVRDFLVEQWLGDAAHKYDNGTNALTESMEDMQSYWEIEGDCWSIEFEIGGVSVEKVFQVAQREAVAAAVPESNTPVERDVANLLSRLERQWHRMGELWERCQGKAWPDKEGAEFNALRDEKAPATRAALLAMLAAYPEVK